jgi:hypothetical protein
MLPVKLTRVLAFAALALALGTSPTPCLAGQKNPGAPIGTMTVINPPDSTLVYWLGESQPHYQIRADEAYNAQSDVWMPTGSKFNPHGQVGVRRFFQTRPAPPPNTPPPVNPDPSTLGPMLELTVLSKDRPANSPFTKTHQIQNYGPYYPDQSTLLSNGLPANEVYGVETIELVFVDTTLPGNPQTVIAYQKFDIYQPWANEAANYFVQNFQQMIALNTATAANPTSYGGDPPRAFVNTTQTVYPGAEIWVVIYSGAAQTTPPSGAVKIPSTDWTAPQGDASQRNNVFMDLGNYVNGPGTYTLQMMQQSAYGLETFGNPASFNATKYYNVNSQLGLTK